MHLLRVSLASVAFFALQAAAQIGEYDPIYSDYDYCQGITSDSKTYKPIPGATLKKVQLFMRHGDRVPSMVFPGDDADYSFCGDATESHYSGSDTLSRTPTVQSKIMDPQDSPYHKLLWKGNCDIGQLTNRGKQQTYNVGKSIRSIYVDMLKFLLKFLNTDIIYVRNTHAVRTRESAEHMLNGLYPSRFRVPGSIIEMNAYPEAVENIVLSSRSLCPALPSIFKPFASTPTFLNFFKSNYALMVKTNNILGIANNLQYNNSLNGDFFISRLCNNMPLPCSRTNATDCITPTEATKAIAGTWVMAYGPMRWGPQVEKVKRISGGMFVGTIPKNIRATLNGDPSSRPFEFYSVHDQSIDQIMAIISAPNTPWPGYSATLGLETWELADKSHVVRAIYEGKMVKAHPDLKCSLEACPLDTFATFLERYVPSDAQAECAV